MILRLTFDIFAKTHGGRDSLALFLNHLVIAGHITCTLFYMPFAFLVAWRKFFREGEHGEDHQQHCHSTQKKPTPPEKETDRERVTMLSLLYVH